MSYDLQPMPAALDGALLARCGALEAAALGHWRLWGMADARLRPMIAAGRVAGTAVTLALPGADGTLLHHALGLLRQGDMLVIDRLGDTLHACVGGIVARAARARGVAAIVVDGPVADLLELRALGLPIWATGSAARTTRRLGLGGRLNAAISVGGAVVHPGDLVLADDDGIAFLRPGEIEEALVRAAARTQREAAIVAGLDAGQALDALLPPPSLAAVR